MQCLWPLSTAGSKFLEDLQLWYWRPGLQPWWYWTRGSQSQQR